MIKKMKLYACIFLIACSFSACELDNYDGPNATISGRIIDKDSKELIQQDIVEGTRIYYEELGWSNPEQQQMAIKVDGSYMNKLMFSGSYDIYFNETNFVRPDTLYAHNVNKGDNTLDFEVQPYIRIADAKIEKVGTKIVATFTVKPTLDKKVRTIALFSHIDYVVGDRFKLVETKNDINKTITNNSEQFTLEIDLTSEGGKKLKEGQEYYFRVGAVMDIGASKYNYAPAVRIKI